MLTLRSVIELIEFVEIRYLLKFEMFCSDSALLAQKQQYLTVSIREALNVHFVFASVPENVASRLFVCPNEPRQNNNVESCATHRINAVRNCLTLIG